MIVWFEYKKWFDLVVCISNQQGDGSRNFNRTVGWEKMQLS
ncbi:hypothetical protein [Candidatus Hikarchaeum yamanae]